MPKYLVPIDMTNNQIDNLGDPNAEQDAVNRRYVDTKSWKTSVRVATTTTGTLATAFEDGETVDGIAIATGDRILIKNQAAGEENGIYVVQASGPPVRASDSNSSAKVRGTVVYVEQGTANANKAFSLATSLPITIDTTPLVFQPFPDASGSGTVQKYAEDIGDTSNTDFTINHNLGTSDVIVQIYRIGSPFDVVFADVFVTDTDNVDVSFAVAPDTDEYRVVVQG